MKFGLVEGWEWEWEWEEEDFEHVHGDSATAASGSNSDPALKKYVIPAWVCTKCDYPANTFRGGISAESNC